MGGTEFNERSGSYWNTTNGPPGDTSAIGYIPETAWNESGTMQGGSYLWSTGGGVSSASLYPRHQPATGYPKPSWQVAPGVPAASYRWVPDVALSAAGHDAYLVQSNGLLYYVWGTSAASPSFAGLMALVVQDTGKTQGNANGFLYQIGNAQYGSGGATVFHNITSGNNSVPGQTGYSCGAGYSPVTGLGSVDANALVNAMQALTGTFGLTVTVTNAGNGVSGSVTSSPSGISCGTTCVAPYSSGTHVTLTATPGSNSYFSGWSGACSGAGPCTVTMSAAHMATATFNAIGPPGAPTGVTATAGNGQATVSFIPPTINGGSAITSYTVTAYLSNGTVAATATGASSPIVVTGLTDGVSYYFTVTATNASGTSSGSTQSNTVTPAQTVSAPALGPWGLMAAAGGPALLLQYRRKRRGFNRRETSERSALGR